jgi:hypothetical protein
MNPLGHRLVASPADVEKQLAEFWRTASTDEQAVMRACSMNLVVVCGDAEGEPARTTELIARIAETAPGRALVVSPARASASEGLEVYVSAHCHRGPGGDQVCSEQVTIETGKSGRDLVPGTVLQLLVEDMPVYTWWRRRELNGGSWLDPLLDLSDYWVLDSATASAAGRQLNRLDALASRPSWRGRVIDAAWARLEPWREAVASFFDHAAERPVLQCITGLRVEAGGQAASAYLAGWLVSRLGFRAGDGARAWLRGDGRPVEPAFVHHDGRCAGGISSVRIDAERDGQTLVFDVRLPEGRDDCLLLSAEAGGCRLHEGRIRLPTLDEAALVCGLLQRPGPDPVYRAALKDAARIAESR